MCNNQILISIAPLAGSIQVSWIDDTSALLRLHKPENASQVKLKKTNVYCIQKYDTFMKKRNAEKIKT